MKTIAILALTLPLMALGEARNPILPQRAPLAPPPVYIAPGPIAQAAPAAPVSPGVPVTTQPAPASPPPAGGYVYEQKPIQSMPTLVPPQQAQGIIERFKTNYTRIGNPRFLIYVNRELVDEKSGLRLSGRTERTETTRNSLDGNFDPKGAGTGNPVNITAGGSVNVNSGAPIIAGSGNITSRTDKVTNENTYKLNERQATLADRQTVRDLEILFGRPLRAAGAKLADQRTASQLIGDRPIKEFTVSIDSDAARRDRKALTQVADAVIEILISSRTITSQDVSGDKTYTIPDIQATAISLKDSQIIGQATSADILGKDRFAGRLARNFDVREIAEATALALMEDINSSQR